jgi:hypothetical protein
VETQFIPRRPGDLEGALEALATSGPRQPEVPAALPPALPQQPPAVPEAGREGRDELSPVIPRPRPPELPPGVDTPRPLRPPAAGRAVQEAGRPLPGAPVPAGFAEPEQAFPAITAWPPARLPSGAGDELRPPTIPSPAAPPARLFGSPGESGAGDGGPRELIDAVGELTDEVKKLRELMERDRGAKGGGTEAPRRQFIPTHTQDLRALANAAPSLRGGR